MEKYRTLKKKIIVLAAIFLAILMTLAGVWYLLSSQEASGEKDLKAMQRKTRAASSKIDAIEVKYELARNSIERYGTLTEELSEGKLSVSKEKVYDLLRQLNELHRISNLKLDIDNVSPIKAGASESELFKTEFTNINVEFDSLSDLHALAFLQAIEEQLEGYLVMNSLHISRERQITREVLQAFAKGEKPRVVSTKVNYAWFGMQPVINDAQEVQSEQ